MIGARPIHKQIDGGVTTETAPLVAPAGADVLVAGSAVFKDGSVSKPEVYGANIAAIRAAAEAAR
jgi:ribulose-phosphate 3-epimerase